MNKRIIKKELQEKVGKYYGLIKDIKTRKKKKIKKERKQEKRKIFSRDSNPKWEIKVINKTKSKEKKK